MPFRDFITCKTLERWIRLPEKFAASSAHGVFDDLNGHSHEQDARQFLDKDFAHPRRHSMSRWLSIMQIDDYCGEQHGYSNPHHAEQKVPKAKGCVNI